MGAQDIEFDIDNYINRFIPRNRLRLLPKPISWFLGYRSSSPSRIGNVLVWWWAFLGAFAGILVVEAVFRTEQLQSEGTPIVIASLVSPTLCQYLMINDSKRKQGAAAILEYHTIESPFSQPRNAVLGQIFSATVGIGITKLFQHSPHFESLRWIAGALSVGVASAVMGITKTVHPPAGATALLCSTSPDITALGWFLLPLIILGSSLLVTVGFVLNNIQRQYPIYWWTTVDLSGKGKDDIERAVTGVDLKWIDTADGLSSETSVAKWDGKITINVDHIVVPDWLPLEYEEKEMLEILRTRLKEGQGLGNAMSRESEATNVDRSRTETNDD
jgi:hypothetical protein